MSVSTSRMNIFWINKNPSLFLAGWGSCFLLLSVAAAFIRPCLSTPLYPYLAAAAALLTLRFKSIGMVFTYGLIAISLLYFYPKVELGLRLWQVGLHLSLALTSFIFLLAFKEVEESAGSKEQAFQEKITQLSRANVELEQIRGEQQEKIKAFEEDIKKLKEEAKLRESEQAQDKRNLQLFRSEIDLLTSQKEEILSLGAHKSGSLVVQDQPSPQLEGLYKQLRSQFDEKTKVLYATRKELFKKEGMVEAQQREEEQRALEPIYVMEKEVDELLFENHVMEQEIKDLEELVSRILQQ